MILLIMGTMIIHLLLFPRQAFILQSQFYSLSRTIHWQWNHYGDFLKKRKKIRIKKLVWTSRVKRLLLFLIINDLVSFMWLFPLFLNSSVLIGFSLFSIIFFPFYIIVPFLVSLPIEKIIQLFYFYRAQKVLKRFTPIIIGVTGSYGKTSTKNYLNALLRHHYVTLVTPQSINTPMGLSRVILEQLNPQVEIFIAEMGVDKKGGMDRLLRLLQPSHGIVTAIGPQHLATFRTINTITKEKMKLPETINPPGWIVLNGDNTHIKSYKLGFKKNLIYYGFNNDNGISATIENEDFFGTSFVIHWKGKDTYAWTPLLGRHHILNLIGAAALAHKLGVQIDSLILSMRFIHHEPHRLSRTIDGLWHIFDDTYNSNKEGFIEALDVIKKMPNTRLLITPGLIELGRHSESVNYDIGCYASQCVDEIYLIGEKHIQAFKNGLIDNKFNQITIFNNFFEAREMLNTRKNEPLSILLENDLPDIILK